MRPVTGPVDLTEKDMENMYEQFPFRIIPGILTQGPKNPFRKKKESSKT